MEWIRDLDLQELDDLIREIRLNPNVVSIQILTNEDVREMEIKEKELIKSLDFSEIDGVPV